MSSKVFSLTFFLLTPVSGNRRVRFGPGDFVARARARGGIMASCGGGGIASY